jgi:hypothetical protein
LPCASQFGKQFNACEKKNGNDNNDEHQLKIVTDKKTLTRNG